MDQRSSCTYKSIWTECSWAKLTWWKSRWWWISLHFSRRSHKRLILWELCRFGRTFGSQNLENKEFIGKLFQNNDLAVALSSSHRPSHLYKLFISLALRSGDRRVRPQNLDTK